MTIRNAIDARALNEAWSNFERCAGETPEGTYEQAKAIAALVSDTAGKLLKDVRELGLAADACDMVREVEAVIYGYVRGSNPDATVFPTAEGCGSALDGPARERVLDQLTEDSQALSMRPA